MKIRIKQHKLPMSSEVRDVLRDKHKTWKDFKKEKSQRNYENYTSARNKVRKLTRQCVRKHEEDVSKSIKHQPKKFWNYVNKKIKTTETIPALKIGPDKWAMNDKDKADTLANFFSSVFTIETPGSWEVVDYQDNQISDDLFISKETILNELNALDITKSMGSDNVHPRVLRES